MAFIKQTEYVSKGVTPLGTSLTVKGLSRPISSYLASIASGDKVECLNLQYQGENPRFEDLDLTSVRGSDIYDVGQVLARKVREETERGSATLEADPSEVTERTSSETAEKPEVSEA